MDINVLLVLAKNIRKRNGSMYVLCRFGRSGKISLFLNMFKSKQIYRKKFYNRFYICPTIKLLSVDKHTFKDHKMYITN